MQGNRNNDSSRNSAQNQRTRNMSVNDYKENRDPLDRPFAHSQNSNFWNENPNRFVDMGFQNDHQVDHQFNGSLNGFHPYNGADNYRLPPPGHGYRGVHFNPNYRPKKVNKFLRTPTDQSKAKKTPEVVDYKKRLDYAKTWAKCDTSDYSKQATIPQTDEWKQFLEPFQVLIAQNMLVLAGDALKVNEKASKSKGAQPALSEAEFRAQWEIATGYLKVARPTDKPLVNNLAPTAKEFE